ncbi:MAG: cytoplasmic protein [Candidatus Omnitrophica bacterium]|nr:cytoplasmic protein [Candidatus Omnitrophota bacterium]
MSDQLISEPIDPIPGSFDTNFMSSGTPGLPREFLWRKQNFIVEKVIKTWRTTGPCHHGSGEQYVRRHWFEVITTSHHVMKLYFDKGNHGKSKEMGWILFTVSEKTPSD